MSLHQQQSNPSEAQGVKTILIVEDDPSIRELLEQALQTEMAYQTLLVPDGVQALEVIHDIKLNLMLLDYNLPFMDGIETYDQLHARQDLEQVPAVIMSARLPHQELENAPGRSA